MASKKIIILHPDDNVAVVISNISENEIIDSGSAQIRALSDIDFGHKMALQDLSVGDTVKKYGVPIGVITKNVMAGSHIHVHNMGSLYMKQFNK